MAQVTTTKLGEGPSHLIVRFDIVGDGTGELIYQPVLYPTDLIPKLPNNTPTFRLLQAWHSLVWFDVSLFGAGIGLGQSQGQAMPIWTFARDTGPHTDLRVIGGVWDTHIYDSSIDDDSGILVMSSNGLVVGSQGSIVLELKKIS